MATAEQTMNLTEKNFLTSHDSSGYLTLLKSASSSWEFKQSDVEPFGRQFKGLPFADVASESLQERMPWVSAWIELPGYSSETVGIPYFESINDRHWRFIHEAIEWVNREDVEEMGISRIGPSLVRDLPNRESEQTLVPLRTIGACVAGAMMFSVGAALGLADQIRSIQAMFLTGLGAIVSISSGGFLAYLRRG